MKQELEPFDLDVPSIINIAGLTRAELLVGFYGKKLEVKLERDSKELAEIIAQRAAVTDIYLAAVNTEASEDELEKLQSRIDYLSKSMQWRSEALDKRTQHYTRFQQAPWGSLVKDCESALKEGKSFFDLSGGVYLNSRPKTQADATYFDRDYGGRGAAAKVVEELRTLKKGVKATYDLREEDDSNWLSRMVGSDPKNAAQRYVHESQSAGRF